MNQNYTFFSFLIFLLFQGCSTVYNNGSLPTMKSVNRDDVKQASINTKADFAEASQKTEATFKDIDLLVDENTRNASSTKGDIFKVIVNQYKRSKE